jgi:hypothetical protein
MLARERKENYDCTSDSPHSCVRQRFVGARQQKKRLSKRSLVLLQRQTLRHWIRNVDESAILPGTLVSTNTP